MKHLALILLTILLSACQTTFKHNELMNVIELSEASPTKGVKGSFELTVLNIGQQGNKVYLNSQMDYRDRRNVSIVIPVSLTQKLMKKYDDESALFFMNKNIKIEGVAKRVKIGFVERNKNPTKYYYQTHIKLTNIDQIEIIE